MVADVVFSYASTIASTLDGMNVDAQLTGHSPKRGGGGCGIFARRIRLLLCLRFFLRLFFGFFFGLLLLGFFLFSFCLLRFFLGFLGGFFFYLLFGLFSRRRCSLGLGVFSCLFEGEDGLSHLDGVALFDGDVLHRPRGGGREVHRRLLGLKLHDRLILGDLVACLNHDSHDCRGFDILTKYR